jgi:hypothetical protein
MQLGQEDKEFIELKKPQRLWRKGWGNMGMDIKERGFEKLQCVELGH